LKKLNDYYSKFITDYKEGPLLIIDADKNKFAENEEDLGLIINQIAAQLYGLF
jgi:deoxyadenosine/deoxycytidine kinase